MRRQAVRLLRRPSRAGRAAARALPGGVPAPRGAGEGENGAGRPGGDPADRHPVRDHQGLPELHRPGAGGHAPAQHRDQAEQEAERARYDRRRPGRLPQRPPRRSTTWSRSSCARSPGRPSRWWTRPTSPTRRQAWLPTASRTPASRLATRFLPVPRHALQRIQRLINQYPTISVAFDPRGPGMRPSVLAAVFPVPRLVPAREYNVLIKWRSRPIRSGGGSEEGA